MLPSSRLERRPQARSLFDRAIVGRARSRMLVRKLDPRWQARNPVMFIVEVGAVVTTLFFVRDLLLARTDSAGFDFAISVWLWFTVLFANFAEAVAEGRGKAQADFLRRTKTDTKARRVVDGVEKTVGSNELRKGDVDPRRRGRVDRRPTARSSKARRRSTSRRSPANRRRSSAKRAATAAAVTGGTRVLSDRILIRVTANPGETFLDRMIALVEGAQRQKTPNEIALSILLSGLTHHFPHRGRDARRRSRSTPERFKA